MSYRYRAFISYSKKDTGFAVRLHRSLEAYKTPKQILKTNPQLPKQLKPIFRDRDELSASGSLSHSLETALDQSEYLIVICSPASATSPWVNEEIKHFKKLGRAQNIYCVIANGRDKDKLFPPALMEPSGLASSDEPEPLAADARKSGDGFIRAKLKLIAGILDVEFDQLFKREHIQKTRRLTWAASGALLVATVTFGLAAYAIGQRATAITQKEIAVEEKEKAKAINAFLQEMMQSANPHAGGERDITLLEVLDTGRMRIDSTFTNQPLLKSALKDSLGLTYLSLDRLEEAESLLLEALEIRRNNLAPDHPDLLESLIGLSDLRFAEGKYIESETLLRETLSSLEMAKSPNEPLQAKALGRLSQTLSYQGRYAEAKTAANEALDLWRRNYPAVSLELAQGLHARARASSIEGSYKEAEPFAEEALSIFRQLLTYTDYRLAVSINELAVIKMSLGDLEGALELFEEARDLNKLLYGEISTEYLTSLENIGNVKYRQDNFEETLAILEEVLRGRRQLLGPSHVAVGRTLANIAYINGMIGNLELSESYYDQALPIFRAGYGDDHPDTAFILRSLGRVKRENGKPAEAEGYIREALGIYIKTFGELHMQVARTRRDLAHALQDQKKYVEAEEQLLAAYDIFVELGDDYDSALQEIIQALLDFYKATAQQERAADFKARAQPLNSE